MSIKKSIASVMTGAVIAGAALVAAAGPAFANDEDPLLPGGIYWFNTVGPLADQTPATQITSGSNAANGGNLGTGRPWATITTENTCPAGTALLINYIRIPQTGVPENDWDQIQVGAAISTTDADGRFYSTRVQEADRLNKPEIMTYLAGRPGNTGVLPFLSVCKDADGGTTGHFKVPITMTGTTQQNLQWSIPLTAVPVVKINTTTDLAASTAGPVEQGTSVTLTATVAPAAATGTVEFLAGATVLGTGTVASGVATLAATNLPVGTSSVTAVYSGDAAYNGSTSAPVSIEVTPVAPRATTTSIVSVTPIDGEQFQNVTIVCEVTAATGLPNGTMTVLDGSAPVISVPVTAGVVPAITTNLFAAGTHELSCSFVGTAPYQNSVSGSITATYVNSGPSQIDEQTVTVTIPAGALTITSPYTPTSPLYLGIATLDPATSKYSASGWFEDIVINDTRAGQLGWTASVVSSAFDNGTSTFSGIHAGLTELVANQLPGNAMQATDVALTNRAPATDGLDVPKVFAGYAAGKSLGSVEIEGRFGIAEVPSSVTPGLYTATVTFTVA